MNLNQVTIPSTDLPRSILFYQKLGLELIVESLPDYARFELPDGDSTLSLRLVEETPPNPGIILYFELTQLDERIKELKDLGIAFESDPQDQEWLWREASLTDPDGNKIILFHAGENRKNPPWRIS